MDLDIRLLGQLEIEVAGDVLPIGRPRSYRLLALLLLNVNNVVPTTRLIEVLWDSPPVSALQQIHNTIGELRRHIATAPGLEIVTTPLGYRVGVDVESLDLTRFRAAVHEANDAAAAGYNAKAIELLTYARELWRGPALAGLDGSYFVNAGLRLEEERLAATELLLSLRVRAGEGPVLVGELTELVRAHPLRESPRLGLMAALYDAGRQADALAVYDQARRLLADEFGLDPSAEMKALHEQILRGLPTTDSTKPAPPAALPPSSVNRATTRRFLPHDSREFSGRTRELLQLVDDGRQTDSVSLVISAINGMGGIGKTALAVRFAHQVADEYPDGQYFVDLRGFTVGVEPLTPATALGILLRQCGMPDELVPPDLDGRAFTWRAEMAGQRALVLLDNAVDEKQVRPLLPGANGPLVLITSRRRLAALEGALPLPLDLMPLDDACALFVRVAGTARCAGEADRIATVVELCGRLPLAIRIAAARFRDRRSWSVSYLAGLLSSQEQRSRLLDSGEGNVSAVLAVSYRYLADDHRSVFRLLSLHPGPDFTVPMAAAAVGIPADWVQTILESLLDDNLLLQDSPGRYHYHDLVRDSATRLSSEHDSAAVRQSARDRLIDYHLQCAAIWCGPMAKGPFRLSADVRQTSVGLPEPESPTECLELLTRESANLVEVASMAIGGHPSRNAWLLVCALQPHFRHTNYAGKALDLFAGALDAARSIGDERGESLCLHGMALVLRERRGNAEAREHLAAAIAISHRNGDQLAEAYQLSDLGSVSNAGERYREAYDHFRAAATIAANLDQPSLQAGLRNNLGLVSREIGRYAESHDHLTEALAIYRTSGQELSVAHALFNIGMLLAHQYRFDEATDRLAEAMRTARTCGYPDVEAAARVGLCMTCRARGDIPRSFEHGRAALGTAREHGQLGVECEALNALGETYLAIADLTNAQTTFRHAADLSHERRLRAYEARAHEGFAHIARRRGDTAAAGRHFEHALSTYPPDVAEANNSRIHLAAAAPPDVTCLRCVVYPATQPG